MADLAETRGARDLGVDALRQLRASTRVNFEAAFNRVATDAEPENAAESIAWAVRYVAEGSGVPDALPGWDLTLRTWLTKVAQRFPDELQAARAQFEGAAQEVLGFCLAKARGEALPEAALTRIARHFLNAAPGRFAFEGEIDLQALAHSAEQLLSSQRFPILQPSRIEQLLPFGSSRLRIGLALHYCGQDFRKVGVRLLDGLTKAECQELPAQYLREPALSPEGGIVLGLFLARTGMAGDPELHPQVKAALLLDLRSGGLQDTEVTEAALRGLAPAQTQALLTETLREERTTVLVPALASRELVTELLERLERGQIDAKLAEQALFRSGRQVIPLLVEFGGSKKRSSVLATVVADTLGQLGAESGAELLVSWLGHTSKTAAVAARKALEKLGDRAAPALRVGAESAKREVRDASALLLGRLALQQASLGTVLERVRDQADALGDAPRIAFLALCTELADAFQSWPSKLRPTVHEYGAVAVYWLRDWFVDRVVRHDARLWCYVVEQLMADPDAVWVAVDSFAALPKVPTNAWAGPRRALATAGALLAEPITHVLTNQSTEYREPLVRLLAKHASLTARELLTAGLLDGRKLVRAHCVDGLSRLPQIDPAPIVALLHTSGLGTRLAVAELLAVWGHEITGDALVNALFSERSERVRPYLQEALVACGKGAALFGVRARRGPALERAVEAFLAQQPPAKVPRFLVLEPLPQLQLASGAELSQVSSSAFLGLVMHLDFTWKGRLLRAMKPAFDEASLQTWSLEVHARWFRAKDSRHKWSVLQLWLFGSTEAVCHVAEGLGKLRPTEHLALTCYLKVLEWNASPEALAWLFHWWNHLRSRGLRATAREFLGRVAYRRGVSLLQLVSEIDPWIAEQARERTLQSGQGGHSLRSELAEVFTSSLISGRSFRADSLLAWEQCAPGAMRGVVLGVAHARKKSRTNAAPSARAPSVSVLFIQVTLDEGRFVDAAGNSVEVQANAELRVLHPLQLLVTDRKDWREFIRQRAIVPLLAQLDRGVFSYGGELDLDFASLATDSARLERWLRQEHWFHGEPLDLGVVFSNSRRLQAHGLVARLHHTGYVIGARDDVEVVSLKQLTFETLTGEPVAADDLDPVLYSEVCLSIARITEAVN